MTYKEFTIAFWHPFGPHGRETPQQILNRKQKEIDANGWTLWSFQDRSDATLEAWRQELERADQVFVFCSEGRGAIDPARDGNETRPFDCGYYRFVGAGASDWQPMPTQVRVPHPFRANKKRACAFVVQQVFYPVQPFEGPSLEWFSIDEGPWRQDKLPTRGEYLIRPGGIFPMRKISAVLELKRPYLAVVTVGNAG